LIKKESESVSYKFSATSYFDGLYLESRNTLIRAFFKQNNLTAAGFSKKCRTVFIKKATLFKESLFKFWNGNR